MSAALKQEDYILISEPFFYHCADRRGTFSILQKVGDEKKQKTYKLSELSKVVASLSGSELDTWIGQSEFNRFNRRLINLERLPVLFSDLDTYSSHYADCSPEQMAIILKNFCNGKGYPEPSLIVFSGRGLQIKWLLKTPLSAKEHPKWRAVQLSICEKFKQFGADSNALDASRLLRLEGTKNTKSGEYARIITGQSNPASYDFDELVTGFGADTTLPTAKAAVSRIQVHKPIPKPMHEGAFRIAIASNNNNPAGNKLNFKPKTKHTLAWSRLLDLRTLADIRGGVGEGQRMLFLFWSLNFMAMSFQVNPVNFWKEAEAIAERYYPAGDWSRSDLTSVFEKVCQQSRGETVEFCGKRFPPLYTPKNSTLIRIFGITSDEQKQLLTIIDDFEKNQRGKKRKELARRKCGMKSYKYSEAKSKPWEALGIGKTTYYKKKKLCLL